MGNLTTPAELLRHRSDPGALLERGAERCGGGAGDRHDAATDHATVDHGGVHAPVAAAGDGSVGDRSDGSHRRRDDRVVAGIPRLTLPPILNAISFAYPDDHVVWYETSCPDFTPRGSEPLAENSKDGRPRHCTRNLRKKASADVLPPPTREASRAKKLYAARPTHGPY
jgi:hypothetical protein